MQSSVRGTLAALVAVSLAGSADVGQFLATRASMFSDAPGRAAGSVIGLAFWVALAAVAAVRYVGGDRRGSRPATVGLAGLVAAGNVGLTLVHLKAGVGGWRPMLGGVLGLAALALAIASSQGPLSNREQPAA